MMALNNDLDNQDLVNQQFRFSHSIFLTKNRESHNCAKRSTPILENSISLKN